MSKEFFQSFPQPQNHEININNYKLELINRRLSFVTSYDQLEQIISTSIPEILEFISNWIIEINKNEEMSGRPETMIPRSANEIFDYLKDGKAVVIHPQQKTPVFQNWG